MNQRILCVTSSFPRWKGDSTTPFVFNLARDLATLGWEIHVLAPHAPGSALREVIDGIHVRRFRYFLPERLQTVCYQGGALINLRRSPSNYLKLPALVAAEILAVRSELRKRPYALIHSHWMLPQGFASLPGSKLLGVPHVVTVHGGDLFGLKGRLFRPLKRLVLASADAVSVNSSFTEAAVKALAGDRCTAHRIPMGVDVATPPASAVDQLRARWAGDGAPNLIFVGRLVTEKGVDDLIQAVALLRNDFPNIQCRMIGEGQHRAEFEQQVAALGLDAQVHFMGWVQSHEVTTYIAAADCFVGPSKTASNGWVEAQGLTFSEAMIARTPVVATRSGGIVDSIIDGETGLLVPEGDAQAIANAVGRVLQDPERTQSMLASAEQHARDRFSRERSAAAFDDLFKQLLGQPQEST